MNSLSLSDFMVPKCYFSESKPIIFWTSWLLVVLLLGFKSTLKISSRIERAIRGLISSSLIN